MRKGTVKIKREAAKRLKLRKKIAAALRRFNKDHKRNEDRITLDDLASVTSLWRQGAGAARLQQRPYLSSVVQCIELEIATIGLLALAACHTGEDRRILSVEFPAKDIHLSASLTNIVNTALAILKLAEEGLDTQARALMRSLDERIYQTALLYSTAADFTHWQKAQTDDESTSAWRLLFSRKKRLRRRLRELEKALGLDLGDEYDLWRDEMDSTYSTILHGGGVGVQVGAYAFSFESETVVPALFGHKSAACRSTLGHVQFQLFYFVAVLSKILTAIHDWKPDLSDAFIARHVAFRDALFDSAHVWFAGKRQ